MIPISAAVFGGSANAVECSITKIIIDPKQSDFVNIVGLLLGLI
jgi:hypothetical protein